MTEEAKLSEEQSADILSQLTRDLKTQGIEVSPQCVIALGRKAICAADDDGEWFVYIYAQGYEGEACVIVPFHAMFHQTQDMLQHIIKTDGPSYVTEKLGLSFELIEDDEDGSTPPTTIN